MSTKKTSYIDWKYEKYNQQLQSEQPKSHKKMPKTMNEEQRQLMAARFRALRVSNKKPNVISMKYINTIDSDILSEEGTIPTKQQLRQLSKNVNRARTTI
jgi:glycerol-3-phosphate cytidylyltransferase-like family protein